MWDRLLWSARFIDIDQASQQMDTPLLALRGRSFRIPQNITGDLFDLFTLSDNMIVKIVLPNEINADST
jgi:hypothetical protein